MLSLELGEASGEQSGNRAGHNLIFKVRETVARLDTESRTDLRPFRPIVTFLYTVLLMLAISLADGTSVLGSSNALMRIDACGHTPSKNGTNFSSRKSL